MVNNLTERELKILSYLIDEDDFIGTTSRKRTHKIDKF